MMHKGMMKKGNGGKGVAKQPITKPGYPKSEEGIAKTVPSPNYPRENFAGNKK